jgi:hypothetical protein
MAYEPKPKRISTQKEHETTCTMCTVNNLLQTRKFRTWSEWLPQAFLAWKLFKESYANAKVTAEKIKKAWDNEIQSARGMSGTIVNQYFVHVLKKQFRMLGPREIISAVKNGCAHLSIKNHGASFGHTVAIKDGYVIDSINDEHVNNGDGVYRWNGRIIGYDYAHVDTVWELAPETRVFIEID